MVEHLEDVPKHIFKETENAIIALTQKDKRTLMKLCCILFASFLLSMLNAAADIQNVAVSVQCPDVMLSWPSQSGETFTVLYRPTLSTNTPWVALTNLLRAAASTNRTTFVHLGIAGCSQTMADGRSGGSGGPPPAPSGQSSLRSATFTEEARLQLYEEFRLQAEATIKYLEALLQEAIANAEVTRQKWQAAGFPTQQKQDTLSSDVSSAAGESLLSGSGEPIGFYRVYKTSPAARTDYFTVQQFSAGNQISILDNDSDPDGDRILLSALTPASNGNIEYTLDASIFRYTTVGSFSGVDSFTYAITNSTGGSAAATAFVFVNLPSFGVVNPTRLTVSPSASVALARVSIVVV